MSIDSFFQCFLFLLMSKFSQLCLRSLQTFNETFFPPAFPSEHREHYCLFSEELLQHQKIVTELSHSDLFQSKTSSLGFSATILFSKYLSTLCSFRLAPLSKFFSQCVPSAGSSSPQEKPVLLPFASSILNNRSQKVICVLSIAIAFCSSLWSPNVILPLRVYDLCLPNIALPLTVEMF